MSKITTNTLPDGKLFRAEAHPDLQKTRPMLAFVPDRLLTSGTFNKNAYVTSRWATINTGANKAAIGSHVFPDLSQEIDPADKTAGAPEFLEALRRLSHKSLGKPSKPKLPGKNEDIAI